MGTSTNEIELISQLASLNIGYLQASVALILGTGVLSSAGLYFVNFKPTEKKLRLLEEKTRSDNENNEKKFNELLNKQTASFLELESNIENEKHYNEKRFDGLLETQEKRFNELVVNIKNLEKEESEKFDQVKNEIRTLFDEVKGATQELEIMTAWSDHYMWEGREVWRNVIRSLISCMQKSLTTGRHSWIVKMCLEQAFTVLDQHTADFKGNADLLDKLEKVFALIKQPDCNGVIEKLQLAISKIRS